MKTIKLSSGLVWVSVSDLATEMGVSKRVLKSLLGAVGLPKIQSGRTWYVDFHNFLLAMKALGGFGQKDFLVPGCHMIVKGLSAAEKKATTRTLDFEYTKQNVAMLIAEMVLARKLVGNRKPADLIDRAREAVERWELWLIPTVVKRKTDQEVAAVVRWMRATEGAYGEFADA